MVERVKELQPLILGAYYQDLIEAQIKKLFKEILYKPILKKLNEPANRLENALSVLTAAIRGGRVLYSFGYFKGTFNSTVSKEIKSLGGVWDKKRQAFRLEESKIPLEVRESLFKADTAYRDRLTDIERSLKTTLSVKITEKLKTEDIFHDAILKMQKDFKDNVTSITVTPVWTQTQTRRVAKEWSENMDLWVKDFSEKQILELRETVKAHSASGLRVDSLARNIQESYGVTERKAKFLARQETKLLAAKFSETQYQEVGINEYRWQCVNGSASHPVRPSHKILDGKIFRWDNPPVTTAPDEPTRRNNPGQDYNCRCIARPIIKFKSG